MKAKRPSGTGAQARPSKDNDTSSFKTVAAPVQVESHNHGIHHGIHPGLVCSGWKPFAKNTLVGFASIHVPAWNLTILGVCLHQQNGKRWAALPAKPYLNTAGDLERAVDGKPRYVRVLAFDDFRIANRFSAAVVAAVDRYIEESRLPTPVTSPAPALFCAGSGADTPARASPPKDKSR
jgi:hypothetical protein